MECTSSKGTGRSRLMVGAAILAAVMFAWFGAACDGGGGGGGGEKDQVAADGGEVEGGCVPDCFGKECGGDGCGGTCGKCDDGWACSAQGECKKMPACDLVQEILCGHETAGDTTDKKNRQQFYSCEEYEGKGPDQVYVFSPSQDDHVVATLTALAADLDILVTQAPCDEETCLGMGADTVELDVLAGKKYYFVVDGQLDAFGPFMLKLQCDSGCAPQCEGRECGSDGCGGTCGKCEGESHCSADGECVEGPLPGCEASETAGCGGCACEACVCGQDDYCCTTLWDDFCAQLCAGPCEGCATGVCGDDVCDAGETCDSCVPDCGCQEGEVCTAGFCCLPSCTGKECGDDGCGGSCGDCPEGKSCNGQFQCVIGGGAGCEPSQTPGCGGCPCEACVCAMDDFCCSTQWDSLCVTECQDQCGGCGPKPCGNGTCDAEIGENCLSCAVDCVCPEGQVCAAGQCCTPMCEGKQCGDDLCGGTCGQCGFGELCLGDGTCCLPQCEGKQCGDNGCGGVCGGCGAGKECYEGICVGPGDFCLKADPESIDFAAKKVGVFTTKTVKLSNCGVLPLMLIDVKIVPEVEGLTIDPQTMPQGGLVTQPGWEHELVLFYMPSEPSPLDGQGKSIPFSSTLLVTTDVPQIAAATTLTGVALDEMCPIPEIAIEEVGKVKPGTILHLDGSGSSSQGGAITKFEWSVVQPDGSFAQLIPSAGAAQPTFEARVVGTYVFTLSVTDAAGKAACLPDSAEVVVEPPSSVYVELVWSTPGDPDPFTAPGSDLDLHVFHPWSTGPDIDGDGKPDPWFNPTFDCWKKNENPDWGKLAEGSDDPMLLFSDSDGWGPEAITLPSENLTYGVGAHVWDDGGFVQSVARVRVYVYGKLAFESQAVSLVELDLWDVCRIEWPSGKVVPVAGDGGKPKVVGGYVNPAYVP